MQRLSHFAGSVTKEATACNNEGTMHFFSRILRSVCTLAEAMDPVAARNNMTATVEQVFPFTLMCISND